MSRIKEFTLPDLGEGLTEGEILSWLVKVGDTIELNQPIVEVETAKAAVEIPAKWAGVVTRIFHEAGETVQVGAPIVAIDTDADAGPEPSAESLREIPPLDRASSPSFGRGEEALNLARGWSRAIRGRPKKGTQANGTSTRSVRLQKAEWEALDAFANARGIKPHTAVREAIIHWLARSQLKAEERRAQKATASSKPAQARSRTVRIRAS